MPVDKNRYPENWSEISRQRREDIAKNRCEWIDSNGVRCEKIHHDIAVGVNGKKHLVVLTTAHLDHTPENCDMNNLRSWCQKHHLAYDQAHHIKNAKQTRLKKRAMANIAAYGSETPLFDHMEVLEIEPSQL